MNNKPKCDLCNDLGVIQYQDDKGLSGCYKCELGKHLLCDNCTLTLRLQSGMGYCSLCEELYHVSEEILIMLSFIEESWPEE